MYCVIVHVVFLKTKFLQKIKLYIFCLEFPCIFNIKMFRKHFNNQLNNKYQSFIITQITGLLQKKISGFSL